MGVDVTVVVPVYNPGHYLDVCVDSLFAQTIAVERREYIFVDDGSTDQTPARLDQLAKDHPEVRVYHQPNSGWPGKPRNVGIDHARGEFVFFSDHDDRLGPEALERMVAMARRTRADVLVPKMVGNGRPVPRRLFRRNLDDARLGVDPLMESLTPHKLFRRAFLNEIGLRFPEGKRRLEDHVFVVEAFLRASVISVMADYPGYHRVHRDDDGNASVQGLDPDFYFPFVAETLDVIDRLTEPGELRNTVLVRPYGGELVGKLAEKRARRWDEAQRRHIFDTIRPMMLQRFPPDTAERLAIARRAHARAILDGDLDRLLAVADRSARPVARAELTDLTWAGDRWQATVEVELVHDDGAPIVLTPEGADQLRLDPRLLPPDLAPARYDREDIAAGYADVIVRDTEAVEWYLPPTLAPVLEPLDPADPAAGLRLVFRGTVELDPLTVAGGSPLAAGEWEIRVRMEAFGIARHVRLRAREDADFSPAAGLFGAASLVATPIAAGGRRGLSLTVGAAPKSVTRTLAQHVMSPTVDRTGRLRSPIRLARVDAPLPQTVALVLLATDESVVATVGGRLVDDAIVTGPIDAGLAAGRELTAAVVDPDRGRGFPIATLTVGDDGELAAAPAEFRAIRLQHADLVRPA